MADDFWNWEYNPSYNFNYCDQVEVVLSDGTKIPAERVDIQYYPRYDNLYKPSHYRWRIDIQLKQEEKKMYKHTVQHSPLVRDIIYSNEDIDGWGKVTDLDGKVFNLNNKDVTTEQVSCVPMTPPKINEIHNKKLDQYNNNIKKVIAQINEQLNNMLDDSIEINVKGIIASTFPYASQDKEKALNDVLDKFIQAGWNVSEITKHLESFMYPYKTVEQKLHKFYLKKETWEW